MVAGLSWRFAEARSGFCIGGAMGALPETIQGYGEDLISESVPTLEKLARELAVIHSTDCNARQKR